MREQRRVTNSRELTNGPAKLCAALGIDRRLDAADLCDAGSEVWIGRNASRRRVLRMLGPAMATTRVGISRAADWPLRFYLSGSESVSRPALLRP